MPSEAGAVPGAPVLLTGASGRLGRVLALGLAERGWTLRLTDRVPFGDGVPPGATFTGADLADAEAMHALASGCAAVLHFGGISTEAAFGAVLDANVSGVFNVFQAARAHGCRVVFASSNHAFGFHERTTALDAAGPFKPDGLYGLSKAYGELLAGLYWDKHGVESVLIRIGSCFARPRNDRMLSTWLSHPDLLRLVERAVLAPGVGCARVWSASANSRSWWRGDDRALLGWQPQDSADPWAPALSGVDTDDPVAERFQGGGMCRRNVPEH